MLVASPYANRNDVPRTVREEKQNKVGLIMRRTDTGRFKNTKNYSLVLKYKKKKEKKDE